MGKFLDKLPYIGFCSVRRHVCSVTSNYFNNTVVLVLILTSPERYLFQHKMFAVQNILNFVLQKHIFHFHPKMYCLWYCILLGK